MLNREHLPSFDAAYWRGQLREIATTLESDASVIGSRDRTLHEAGITSIAPAVMSNMRTAAAQLRQLAGQLQDDGGAR